MYPERVIEPVTQPADDLPYCAVSADFNSMFTTYTYLAVILEQRAGFDCTLVGFCLIDFCTVGLIGNSLGGLVLD